MENCFYVNYWHMLEQLMLNSLKNLWGEALQQQINLPLTSLIAKQNSNNKQHTRQVKDDFSRFFSIIAAGKPTGNYSLEKDFICCIHQSFDQYYLLSKIKPFKINFGKKNQSKKKIIQKRSTTKQRLILSQQQIQVILKQWLAKKKNVGVLPSPCSSLKFNKKDLDFLKNIAGFFFQLYFQLSWDELFESETGIYHIQKYQCNQNPESFRKCHFIDGASFLASSFVYNSWFSIVVVLHRQISSQINCQ